MNDKGFVGFIERVIDISIKSLTVLTCLAAIGTVTVIALLGTLIYLIIK